MTVRRRSLSQRDILMYTVSAILLLETLSAAAEAAREGEPPRWLGRESRSGTPMGAALVMGLFSTSILILYGTLAGSGEELFWSLFAFSALIFLLPYLGLMLAFVRARTRDGTRPRPFRLLRDATSQRLSYLP